MDTPFTVVASLSMTPFLLSVNYNRIGGERSSKFLLLDEASVMNIKLTVVLVMLVVGLLFATPQTADATFGCQSCVCQPTMERTICVTDPCTGCSQQVCVSVPCCCTEDPCVTCRSGILGRTVLTYCWGCCGHSVDVVINCRGKIRVR